jgi:hypothetical protein
MTIQDKQINNLKKIADAFNNYFITVAVNILTVNSKRKEAAKLLYERKKERKKKKREREEEEESLEIKLITTTETEIKHVTESFELKISAGNEII